MGSEGSQLLAFVKDIRTLCRQAAELLGATEDCLSRSGWERWMAQNIAFANVSSSLDRPEAWFPFEVFRFYQNSGFARRLAFVSLLLDDDRDGEYSLSEPLATAGWFEFPADVPAPRIAQDSWWWARFHGYMPNRRDDGTLHTVRPREVWPDQVEQKSSWYPFEIAATLGVPLVEMTSAAILHERLVEPLMQYVSAS